MSKKILIFEDEETIIELTKSLLEKRGYEVRAFTDGHNAFAAIEKERPDLVILDNILPGDNGLNICHAVKSSPSTRHIPVIISTGASFLQETLQEAHLLPPNDYLIKPFEIDDLIQKVEDLLGTSQNAL